MDSTKLSVTLARHVDEIANLPIFKELESGNLSKKLGDCLFVQYEIVSNHFPQILCILGSRITSDEARSGIISNLWDEHGRGDISNSHRRMLRKFLDRYFGEDRARNLHPSWQTSLFINGVSGICNFGDFSESLGAMILFEAVTPSEYRPILSWLRKRSALTEDDFEFWMDHIEHDGDHVHDLLDCMSSEENIDQDVIKRGIEQAAAIEKMYWSQFG